MVICRMHYVNHISDGQMQFGISRFPDSAVWGFPGRPEPGSPVAPGRLHDAGVPSAISCLP
jgi:hypothetical protein